MLGVIVIVLSIAAPLFWSIAQVSGKIALKNTSVGVFSIIRFSIALVGSFILAAFFEKIVVPEIKLLLLLLLSGFICWVLGAGIYFYVIKKGIVHKIAPIANSHPVLTVLLAVAILRERLTAGLIIACLLLVIGLILFRSKFTVGGTIKYFIPVAFLVAFCWAAGTILTKVCLLERITVFNVMFYKLLATTVTFLGVVILFRNFYQVDPLGIKYSIISGASLFVGELCYTLALNILPAAYISIFLSLAVPFSFLLAVLWLRERPEIRYVVGMIFFFSAVLVVTLIKR